MMKIIFRTRFSQVMPQSGPMGGGWRCFRCHLPRVGYDEAPAAVRPPFELNGLPLFGGLQRVSHVLNLSSKLTIVNLDDSFLIHP